MSGRGGFGIRKANRSYVDVIFVNPHTGHAHSLERLYSDKGRENSPLKDFDPEYVAEIYLSLTSCGLIYSHKDFPRTCDVIRKWFRGLEEANTNGILDQQRIERAISEDAGSVCFAFYRAMPDDRNP